MAKEDVGRIKPVDLEKIGRTMQGKHWNADMSRGIGVSKSMISYVLGGKKGADFLFANNLRRWMINKIASVAALLATKGLPYADQAETKVALKQIEEAVRKLKALDGKALDKAA